VTIKNEIKIEAAMNKKYDVEMIRDLARKVVVSNASTKNLGISEDKISKFHATIQPIYEFWVDTRMISKKIN
jgi:hypothetical protein